MYVEVNDSHSQRVTTYHRANGQEAKRYADIDDLQIGQVVAAYAQANISK
ncbi:hypothetical protein [Lacticaseibacillus pantheris]|nr:hypothetical protein [Lacticaseibacillus pantheris]WKF84469.1 hypothetical protein QY874_09270 [Lacticaseibacillus pantheris]